MVSVHLKLSPASTGLLDAERLARMRPGAILVNTARGAIVDEPALVDALRGGRLAGAGLDVFATEPLPADHPLRTAPNVVLTPHIGWKVEEVFAEWAEIAAEQLAAWLDGRLPAAEVLDPRPPRPPPPRAGGPGGGGAGGGRGPPAGGGGGGGRGGGRRRAGRGGAHPPSPLRVVRGSLRGAGGGRRGPAGGGGGGGGGIPPLSDVTRSTCTRRGCSCMTPTECRPWSTLPPCGTRWPVWEETRRR